MNFLSGFFEFGVGACGAGCLFSFACLAAAWEGFKGAPERPHPASPINRAREIMTALIEFKFMGVL